MTLSKILTPEQCEALRKVALAGVPVNPSGDMIVNFNESLDGRRAWVNQIKDGLTASIKAGDLLGGGE